MFVVDFLIIGALIVGLVSDSQAQGGPKSGTL
jgi:hypothetical protein